MSHGGSVESRPVAVVGAGITGLTAAFALARRGVPVVVYEGADRVGGVIRTVREGGYLAEFGPNSILETSARIADLIEQLGLTPRRLYSSPEAENRYLVRYRRPIVMAPSPVKFFTTPLFSWRAKLALLREPFIARAPAEVEENLADFVVRRLCREFLDYAINPLVAGIYAGDPARLSVRHAFPKLHALEQRYGSLIKGQIFGAKERKRRGEISKQEAKKVSFDEGLQVLTDTLRERLGESVRLGTQVKAVRRVPAGWRLEVTHGVDRQTAEHSAVLLAAPPFRWPEVQTGTRNEGRLSELEAIVYPPVASVVLGFRREDVAHPLDGFGMLIPAAEGFSILGTLFSSSLFPGRAPAGHVTLTSYVGGMRAPELALRPPEALVGMTVRDLGVILGVRGQPTFQHTVLYSKAIPQYEVGYGRFKDIMAALEQEAPGLFFAGHYRDGISLGDSILSALAVAERIAEHTQGAVSAGSGAARAS